MDSERFARQTPVTRRQALIAGASGILGLGAVVAGPGSPAHAAAHPRLPGETGRQNGLVSRYGGGVFDHIRVSIKGDGARLFIPRGIVPGSQDVSVLWLYHGASSSEDALIGGFRGIGERAVDIGVVAVCQNLGGTLYSAPAAVQRQIDGSAYLSAQYGIGRSFMRGTSHGGAMAVEALVRDLVPAAVGSYIVNGVYDIEDLYLNGSAQARYSVGEAFGYDLAAIRAANPARHRGTAWSGKRVRVVYSQPDRSDATTPPPVHGKALIATATPSAVEASARTHTSGHNTPGFADLDNQQTISRWITETGKPRVPRPIAQWDFAEASAPFASSVAGAAALVQGAGATVARVSTPFGGGVELDGRTDFLRVPAASVGPLNVGATTGKVTVAAWVYSTDANNANIAGCWQESRSDPRRSYALFNDLPMYGGDDMVCMEVSKGGGATPGYPFSIDYAAHPRKMTRGAWQFHVGTYDGAQAVAYLDGVASPYPTFTDDQGATYAKNPYIYPDGLNAAAVDFTVGAVVRDGSLINLHKGRIARLRVWDRALTAEQIAQLYAEEKTALAS